MLGDLLYKVIGVLRWAIFWIDSIGFAFIDNAYNFMLEAMKGFNADSIRELAASITKNAYVIVGIFALFKVAVSLINSIVNPEKLTDKKEGTSSILFHFVGTIILFIATPIIFNLSREVQTVIMDGSYISKLIIGVDLNSVGNAGQYMQLVALKSIITPDPKAADANATPIGACSSDANCKKAIEDWSGNKMTILNVSNNISTFVKDGDDYVFAYNYIPFLTLATGLFMTYVLLSFTIDIAIRSVELAVLEILSPIFIITFVDPKSASSGPFSKWLKACTKSYLSLFIKVAVVSLMLLLISNLDTLLDGIGNNGNPGLLKLLMLIAILIFAKKAPKWLGDMFGLADGAGLGGLGIGKKLAGAAGIGGLIQKGSDAAKGYVKQKGKNFVGNRARNTAARIGAMKETAAQNHQKRKNSIDGEYDRTSLWKQGRAAAKQSKADNYGKDVKSIKDVTAGYMAGRTNVNPAAKTIKENMNDKFQVKNAAFQASVGNTEEKRAKALDMAKKNKIASKLYNGKLAMDPSGNGDRIKVEGLNGKSVYLNPQGAKEMNEAFNHPTTVKDAFEAYGTNLALHQGVKPGDIKIDNNGNKYFEKDGKQINLAEFGAQNMTRAGRLAVASLAAENLEKDVANYETSRINLNAARQDYSTSVIQYNQASANFNNDERVIKANEVLSKEGDYKEAKKLIAQVAETQAPYQATIAKIESNEDYQKLKNSDYEQLTMQDKKRFDEYQDIIKNYREVIESNESKCSGARSLVAEYEGASVTLAEIKDSYGLAQMEAQMEESKKRIASWQAEVNNYESKFKNARSYEMTNDGDYKKNSDGTLVEINPYDIEIPGKTDAEGNTLKVNVAGNYSQINEIKTILNMKTSKTKKEYEDEINPKKD